MRSLAVPIDTLRTDPTNARTHSGESIRVIKNSLEKFGQRAPIIAQVAKNGAPHIVRAGNGRLEAARLLKWEYIAAVIVDEPDVDAVAFAITDNRAAELAEWDIDKLLDNVAVIEHLGLETAGFTDETLADIIGSAHEKELPEIPDPDGLSVIDKREAQVTYTISFDTVDQHKRFVKFLKKLKGDYPDIPTAAGRLDRFIGMSGD